MSPTLELPSNRKRANTPSRVGGYFGSLHEGMSNDLAHRDVGCV